MRTELRLEQRMILSPQLMLNLKLLQVSRLELDALIEAELETNPALEERDEADAPETLPPELDKLPETSAVPEVPGAPEAEPAPTEDLTGMSERYNEAPDTDNVKSALESGEIRMEDYLKDDWQATPREADYGEAPEGEPFESVGGGTMRLGDKILPGLRSELAPADLRVAEAIVENLDEDGLLIVSHEELTTQLGVTEAQFRPVLSKIQHWGNGGVGARDVREALILQLEVKGYAQDALECRILAQCYELLPRRHYPQIARRLHVTEAQVQAAIHNICELNPRPASEYNYSDPGFVRSDFVVDWMDGKLNYYSTDDYTPRLRLSARYREILTHPKGYSDEQVEFARKKLKGAVMLLKAIDARRRTLAGLMRYILKEQERFLVDGREHLKPMSITAAATFIGVHPSTISRAVAGKYIDTPCGVRAMRDFFSGGTDGCARYSVKDRLRRIIEEEDKRSPLRDERLVELLAQEGITLSRRTVAKYRDELGIPSAPERRGR